MDNATDYIEARIFLDKVLADQAAKILEEAGFRIERSWIGGKYYLLVLDKTSDGR